jgi:hypothetical protein
MLPGGGQQTFLNGSTIIYVSKSNKCTKIVYKFYAKTYNGKRDAGFRTPVPCFGM